MKTKLTLYWDSEFTKKAKAHAQSKGLSLSGLVEELLVKKWEMEYGKDKKPKI